MQAIVVVNDSTEAGRLMFTERNVEVASTARCALIPVTRRNGADGRVSVHYSTVDGDALAGALLISSAPSYASVWLQTAMQQAA